MKFKMLLLAVFVAGVGASLALAEGGKPKDGTPACNPVHLEGTAAPQSLTMTVLHSGPDGAVAAGTPVTLAVGATGQTVRVNVEACASGSSFVVKHLELRPLKPNSGDETTTSTSTNPKHGDDGGDHHGDKGGSTTAPVTTTTTKSGDDGDHHGDKGGSTTAPVTTTTTP